MKLHRIATLLAGAGLAAGSLVLSAPAEAATGTVADPTGDTEYAVDITKFTAQNNARAIVVTMWHEPWVVTDWNTEDPIGWGSSHVPKFKISWGVGKSCTLTHTGWLGTVVPCTNGEFLFPGECATVTERLGSLTARIPRRCIRSAPDQVRVSVETHYNGVVLNPDGEPDPNWWWFDKTAKTALLNRA